MDLKTKLTRQLSKATCDKTELDKTVLKFKKRFDEANKLIKNDKKKPGVLIELHKSSMIWDIVRLIQDGVMTVKDLEGFSDELIESVEFILNR